jgi:hypothetical protein
MRRFAVLLAAAAFAAAAAIAAPISVFAETHANCATFDNFGNVLSVTPNCSQTISVQGGQPQVSPGVDPCTGDKGTLTMATTHQVFHVNVNGASDFWITGTQNGTITFTPDTIGAPSGSGPWAAWFGGGQNNQSGVLHDTFNAQVHLTNGQTVSAHVVDHFNFTPTGFVNSFTMGGAPVCR